MSYTTQDFFLRLNLSSLNTTLKKKHPNHAQIKISMVIYSWYKQENEGFKRREIAESGQCRKIGSCRIRELVSGGYHVKTSLCKFSAQMPQDASIIGLRRHKLNHWSKCTIPFQTMIRANHSSALKYPHGATNLNCNRRFSAKKR